MKEGCALAGTKEACASHSRTKALQLLQRTSSLVSEKCGVCRDKSLSISTYEHGSSTVPFVLVCGTVPNYAKPCQHGCANRTMLFTLHFETTLRNCAALFCAVLARFQSASVNTLVCLLCLPLIAHNVLVCRVGLTNILYYIGNIHGTGTKFSAPIQCMALDGISV